MFILFATWELFLQMWGDTALTEAASNCNLDTLKNLIDFNADPNQSNSVHIA